MNKNYKKAHATKWADRILINSVHETEGPFIDGAPYFLLSVASTPDEIGKALQSSLNNSKILNIIIPDYKKLREERFKAAHVKSEKDFMKNALNVSILDENNEITFIPSTNGGTKGNKKGFRYLEDKKIVISKTDNTSKIGGALLEALNQCS